MSLPQHSFFAFESSTNCNGGSKNLLHTKKTFFPTVSVFVSLLRIMFFYVCTLHFSSKKLFFVVLYSFVWLEKQNLSNQFLVLGKVTWNCLTCEPFRHRLEGSNSEKRERKKITIKVLRFTLIGETLTLLLMLIKKCIEYTSTINWIPCNTKLQIFKKK